MPLSAFLDLVPNSEVWVLCKEDFETEISVQAMNLEGTLRSVLDKETKGKHIAWRSLNSDPTQKWIQLSILLSSGVGINLRNIRQCGQSLQNRPMAKWDHKKTFSIDKNHYF